MVKCEALSLAVSILLATMYSAATPRLRSGNQAVPDAAIHADSQEEAPVPVHRVILFFDPVSDLSDPLVLSVHNKSLAQRVESKRKHSLPRPKLPGDSNAAPTFTIPGAPQPKAKPDPVDSINLQQLTALADLYLSDELQRKLSSGYRITVLESKEVNTALTELHISRDMAVTTQSAQELCTHLECDAVVVLGRPMLTMRDGQTRNLVIRVEIHLAALRNARGGFEPTHKPRDLPIRAGAAHTKPDVEFMIAGSAEAGRAFMRPGYASNYASLVEHAAVQAAAIALHALSTGEQQPIVDIGTRISIAPAYGPDRADMLVLSSAGRHTDIGAVQQLPMDVSGFFNPDLLPVLSNDVIDAAATSAVMRRDSMSRAALWRDNYTPNFEAVRNLGNKLRVQYMLLAHITDVEVSTAPSGGTDRAGSSDQSEQSPSSTVVPWEREAHAEACGALVRIRDGAVIWTDRGDTTFTSREKVSPNSRTAANRSIAMDAEKFALIDLKRRFATFRSQFEQ